MGKWAFGALCEWRAGRPARSPVWWLDRASTHACPVVLSAGLLPRPRGSCRCQSLRVQSRRDGSTVAESPTTQALGVWPRGTAWGPHVSSASSGSSLPSPPAHFPWLHQLHLSSRLSTCCLRSAGRVCVGVRGHGDTVPASQHPQETRHCTRRAAGSHWVRRPTAAVPGAHHTPDTSQRCSFSVSRGRLITSPGSSSPGVTEPRSE